MDHIAQSTNELYNSLGATYILKKVNQLPYYTGRTLPRTFKREFCEEYWIEEGFFSTCPENLRIF